MRFVYSGHALTRLEQRGITESMVERVLAAPDILVEGETADEYTATVDGLSVCVVLARQSEPRVIITVYLPPG